MLVTLSPNDTKLSLNNLNLWYKDATFYVVVNNKNIKPQAGIEYESESILIEAGNNNVRFPLPKLAEKLFLSISQKSTDLFCISANGVEFAFLSIGKVTVVEGINQLAIHSLENALDVKGIDFLDTLYIFESSISSLEKWEGGSRLKKLDISLCNSLTDISALSILLSIETLVLSSNKSLLDLKGLEDLKSLKELYLSDCDNLSDVSPLRSLTSLETLNLNSNKSLRDLKGLEGLNSLKELYLSSCDNLSDVSPLRSLTSLEMLNLYDNKSLRDLKGLEDLKSLKDLNLGSCENLSDVSPLRSLTSLETLNLYSNKSLRDLKGLEDLKSLKDLDLSSCKKLNNLSPLKNLPSLEVIYLSGSPYVTLDVLQTCKKLRKISFGNPAEANSILALLGAERKDTGFIQENLTEWIESFEPFKTAEPFATRLLDCLELIGGSEAFLLSFFTALSEKPDLLPETLERGVLLLKKSVIRETYQSTLQTFAETLKEEKSHILLGALIATLSDPKSEDKSWTDDLVIHLTKSVLETKRPSEIAEIGIGVCIYYVSTGETESSNLWMDLLSERTTPITRDKLYLALSRKYLKAGENGRAHKFFLEIKYPEMRDAYRMDLVETFLKGKDMAGAEKTLLEMETALMEENLAEKLGENQDYLTSEKRIYGIILALERNSEKMYNFLSNMVERSPDNELVSFLAKVYLPTEEGGANLDSILLDYLNTSKLEEILGKRDKQKLEKVLQDNKFSKKLLVTGFLNYLETEEMIEPEDKKELESVL